MQGYENKEAMIAEIKKTADLFRQEFETVAEADKHLLLEGVDRTPQQMLAYQLGWMSLLRGWDADELAGREVITPAPGLKWNQMGQLYERFYQQYSEYSMKELQDSFVTTVNELTLWLGQFTDEELFQPGGRKWAASTSSNWPVWKWVHINTVAPFKSFRSKIRKWKKLKN